MNQGRSLKLAVQLCWSDTHHGLHRRIVLRVVACLCALASRGTADDIAAPGELEAKRQVGLPSHFDRGLPPIAKQFADEPPTEQSALMLAEIPLVPDCDNCIVKGQLLGEDRYFIFATGYSNSVLSSSLRASLGELQSRAPISTPTGKSLVELFKAPRIILGSIRPDADRVRIHDDFVVCSDLSGPSEHFDFPLAGIIGMGCIASQVVELNLAERSIRIYDRVPTRIKEHGKHLPFRLSRGKVVASVTLPDVGCEDVLVESGMAGNVMLRADVYDRLSEAGHIKCRRSSRVTTGAGVLAGEVGKLSRMTMRGFEHANLTVARGPTAVKRGRQSTIASDFLRRYVVVIDYPERELYLRPSKLFDAPEPPTDKSGLKLIRRDGRVLISHCDAQSPASDGGLREGDRILRVNDTPVDFQSLFELRRTLQQEGETVKITFERDEKTRDVQFDLREYREFLPDPEPTDSSPPS